MQIPSLCAGLEAGSCSARGTTRLSFPAAAPARSCSSCLWFPSLPQQGSGSLLPPPALGERFLLLFAKPSVVPGSPLDSWARCFCCGRNQTLLLFA